MSHIRTQWCLADCLTKKSANPQNLTDAVRSSILIEVDSHPPFRSLLEHKAYLRSWLPTVCSHVDFKHDVFLFCDSLRDSCLFFEFVLAAQERETRDSHCFFTTMSGSNQWNGSSGSTARGSTGPIHVPEDDEPYLSEDDEHQPPPEGYAARKSREVPHHMDRTRETRPHEDHMEVCFAFRQQCAWYQDKELVKLSVERGIHSIQGPANMSPCCRRQMAMDSVSWCLYWEKRQGFDHFLKWQAEFIQHLIGWLTQDEENEFKRKCDSFYADMTGKKGSKSNYFGISKALSGMPRHSKKKYLFNATGTVNLGSAFTELDWHNPIRQRMSPADVAALLLANDKDRFRIEIIVSWTWKPFGYPPTQPWDIRIGCNQGHSNQVVAHYAVHHPLTFEESMCLGWIFHVTDASNRQSIEQRGLLLRPAQGRGKDGRDSVHFMHHNDNSPGCIRMAEGTVPPSS